MTLKEIYAIPVDGNGWRLLPNGNHLHIGINVVSNVDLAKIGSYAEIGSYTKIGPGAKIGPYAKIGSYAEIGSYTKIGPGAKIGSDAEIPEKSNLSFSPLAVQGSRHLAGNYAPGMIQIGCLVYSFAEWKENFRTIGQRESYTESQIEEYSRIIDFIIQNGMQP